MLLYTEKSSKICKTNIKIYYLTRWVGANFSHGYFGDSDFKRLKLAAQSKNSFS